MNPPRPATKCRRCKQMYALHAGKGPEHERACPWKPDSTFQRHTPRPGASQSFNEREIAVLDQITKRLLTGRELHSYLKLNAKELGNLARKVDGMKRTVAARRNAR